MRISYQSIFPLIFWLISFSIQLFANHAELAGDLPKVVSADKSPYLVVADIFVPAGKIVRIEPGTVFLFKNFTGIHVQGLLIANGTESLPVIFTSENDRFINSSSSLNPTPYDWNGIYIHKDGVGTDLQHFKIQYSVKGIISETRFIRILEGVFFENGRSSLIIEGAEKSVMESAPYSYSLSVKDVLIDGVPVKILHDPEARKRNRLRYTGLGMCAAGAVAGTFATMELANSIKAYEAVQNKNDDANLMKINGNSEWSEKRSEVNRNIVWVVSSFLFSAAGAAVLTLSFTF